MYPRDILQKSARLIEILRSQRRIVTTAESCTGGLVAGAITAIAGSSDVFRSGFVTYADDAKISMLGVDADLIERHGAVSSEVGKAMAEGARARAGADVAVAVTGIAGPGGGSALKPVGLVYIAWASPTRTEVVRYDFGDVGRDHVRFESVRSALGLLEGALR